MDLPARIASLRKSMKLSQEKFGELFNMSQRSVAAWESGERTPSFETLIEIADKANVSTDWLFGRSDEKCRTIKKQPADQNDELLYEVLTRVQSLSDPALLRLACFLEGLVAGQEIAAPVPADHGPDSGSAE